MNNSTPLLRAFTLTLTLSLAAFSASLVQADHHEEKLPSYAERATAIQINAEVVSVNQDTREMVLRMPTGEQMTTVVGAEVERLAEIDAGDFLVVSYVAALAADLREPTEEEKANPWLEGADAGVAGADESPAGAVISAVRAVCTIEGMNRLTGTVTILDSRGMTHVIGDVKAQRIEELRIGQSVVITFTQAVAVSIEKVSTPG